MDKKRAKIKRDEYLRKLNDATKDLPMSKEGSPTIQKFSDSGLVKQVEEAMNSSMIGPSNPKGSVSPRMRAYDDEFESAYGAGVNITTKKGVSFDFDVDKTKYKKSNYKEPESYKASVSKQGDKLSYGVSGTKKGKSNSIEAGLTFKYSLGKEVNLKPVPAEKEKSLGKLPPKIRNRMGYASTGMEVRGYGAARTKGMGLQDESVPMKNNDYIKDLID